MVNGIGRVHNISKYNRQKYAVTNRPFSTNLTNSYSYDRLVPD